MEADDRLEAYARLVVEVGINLQPGQDLLVTCQPEHLPVARAVARVGYEMGAHWVDVQVGDPHVRRALIQNGPDESLEWAPPWLVERVEYAAQHQAAHVSLTGDAEPDLFGDLDLDRVGRARPIKLTQTYLRAVAGRRLAWTVAGAPNEGWARAVFGEPDVDRLWEAVATTVRLDEPDPVAAWREHVDRLKSRAKTLTERRFDAIRFSGPNTDLTIGLLPSSKWVSADEETEWGQRHVPNVPTEEVFTSPDPARADGMVRSTYPLVLSGAIVRDLEVRFEGGRAVDVQATAGAEVVRAQMKTDDGASRLGEVALVDGASRVGATGITFLNTLYDENASSHIAYGQGLPIAVDAEPGADGGLGINESSVHTDFMIGGAEVDAYGVDKDGSETPIIRAGNWVLA